MKKNIFWMFLLAVSFGVPSAHAKITLNYDFQGTVMITSPDGKVTMLNAGDKIPEIPSDSRIDVFEGHIQVTTENGDRVTAACSGNEGQVSGGSSADLACKSTEASLKVLEGTVDLKDTEGNTVSLEKGAEQKLTLSPEGLTAPETAAGEEIGTPVKGVNPVDSRSLESSPTQ